MDKKLLPEDVTLENIHTMSSDTFEALERQKVEQAKLAAKREIEEDKIRREREYRDEQVKAVRTHKFRNIVLLLCGVVALIGVSVFMLNLVNKKSQTTPVQPVPEEITLVPFNTKKDIPLMLTEIQTIGSLRERLIFNGTVGSEGITYLKTDPSIFNLLRVLSPSISPEFLRNILDVFWGGVPQGNFIVMKVDSYDRAFAGMLEWERAMSYDMAPLFGITASTTMAFEDRVIENKDVRVIYGMGSEVVFLYGFFDPTTIIIAKNEEVFSNIYNTLLRKNL